MPTVSAANQIRKAKQRLRGSRSAVDLALVVRAQDGAPILTAGGDWIDDEQRYDAPGSSCASVHLVSSQLRAGQQLAQWFEAYEADDPNRQALDVYVDNRRGGKTFFSVLAIVLFALRYPFCHLGKTICWLVVPTFPQQRELHECIAKILPASWFLDGRIVYHKSEKYYTLANGSEIWIKSADRPQSLKAGGVAAIAVNEAQQVDSKSILNAMGANIDSGGICWLAMNPPDSVKGLWAENVHHAISAVDDKGNPVIPWARETAFPSTQNEVINQAARTRFAKIAEIIDPAQAKRDAAGLWTSITDRAYPFYRREQHFKPEPTGWRDITAEMNNITGMLGRRALPSLGAGMDFQKRPWCAFIEAKAFAAPAGLAWIAAGEIVYVVTQEICNDVVAGDWWTEELLCMKVAENIGKRKLTPADYLLIADRTGQSQGSELASRGQSADPETYSWPIVERFGWEPHAPEEERRFSDNLKGPTDIKIIRKNPLVSVRLNTINEVLRSNRLIISTACPQTAESFRQCEVYSNSRKPKGDWAHLTDAVGYLIFVWETARLARGVTKILS